MAEVLGRSVDQPLCAKEAHHAEQAQEPRAGHLPLARRDRRLHEEPFVRSVLPDASEELHKGASQRPEVQDRQNARQVPPTGTEEEARIKLRSTQWE